MCFRPLRPGPVPGEPTRSRFFRLQEHRGPGKAELAAQRIPVGGIRVVPGGACITNRTLSVVKILSVQGLASVCFGNPGIEYLDISRCGPGLTDEGVAIAVEVLPRLRHVRRLQAHPPSLGFLPFEGCDTGTTPRMFFCLTAEALTQAFRALAFPSPSTHAYHSGNLLPSSTVVAKSVPVPYAEQVCMKLVATAVPCGRSSCGVNPRLPQLDSSGNSQIGHNLMVKLSRNCKHLQYIAVTCSQNLNDEAILSLVKNQSCGRLEAADFRGTPVPGQQRRRHDTA